MSTDDLVGAISSFVNVEQMIVGLEIHGERIGDQSEIDVIEGN